MKTKHASKLFLMGVVFLAVALLPNAAQAEGWETVIPSDSLTPGNFDTYWNWFYRWGDTHNGSAKMYIEQVTLDGSGMATIVAETPDPCSEWKYRSGAFHSKAKGSCDECYPEWDLKGEFRAPTVKGSWPAFWYNGIWNWPPEIDILEFKGTVQNWFNTYDGGWETRRVRVPDAPDVWHEYRCHITQLNDTDVQVQFYLDGALKSTDTGSNFVGEPMEVIVNLQMEGSSGSPGPTEPTYYYARNIVVERYVAVPPAGPPVAPTNLVTSIEGDVSIDLNWDSNNSECDFSHYNLYRSETSGGPYTQIDTELIDTAYTDTDLVSGITYYYVVTAVDFDLNESDNSNEASETAIAMYPVTIDNYSFEDPPGGKQIGQIPTGWAISAGTNDYGIEGYGYDGVQCAFLGGNDNTFYQLTDHTIAEGEQLLLTYYGSRAWSTSGRTATFTGNLYYDDSGSRETIASAPGSTEGGWDKYTVETNIIPGHPAIGKTLGVALVHTTAATDTWAGFDYVSVNSIATGYCGDGTCDPGEDQCNCSDDCGTPPSTETSCTDGIDNDCDTYTDCDDSDCDGDPACPYCGDGTCDPGEDQCNCPDDCGTPPSTETSCTDGVDNDCDTYTDCDDSDCDTDPACMEPFCGDDTCDPDEDQCNCPEDCGTPPSTETSCTDGVDNDCDTYTDCDDSDCDGDPACPDCVEKGGACTADADCCSGDCLPAGRCK
jgi:hypothetical protein